MKWLFVEERTSVVDSEGVGPIRKAHLLRYPVNANILSHCFWLYLFVFCVTTIYV